MRSGEKREAVRRFSLIVCPPAVRDCLENGRMAGKCGESIESPVEHGLAMGVWQNAALTSSEAISPFG
jgi:hypothetical protein